MDAKTAVNLLGTSTHGVPFNNMIKALGLHPWLNTSEEKQRLEAAKWVRSHRKAYDAECARRREVRRG